MPRPLSVLGISAALAIGAAAPAQAFTPAPAKPAPNGIIAILIG